MNTPCRIPFACLVLCAGVSACSSAPITVEFTGDGSTATSTGGSSGGPSCRGLAVTCGPSRNDDCCKSLLVPGGTFYRGYDGVDLVDPSYPATVAEFYLDKYEITVGRFRQFVKAGMGTQDSPPAPGAGAHPLIPGSGWDSKWTAFLPWITAGLIANLKCNSTYQTWTDTAAGNETRPINCLDWFTAAAFCAWDGGRLATAAEWNYAAAGGSEQRYYPWSNPPTSTTVDDSYAVYCGGSCSHTQNVGVKSPKGDGKWGHSDLGGNVWEWVLDGNATYANPCDNCAALVAEPYRLLWGGSFDGSATGSLSAQSLGEFPERQFFGFGARCARTSP